MWHPLNILLFAYLEASYGNTLTCFMPFCSKAKINFNTNNRTGIQPSVNRQIYQS